MNKDEKRALGSAALHRKELLRKRLMETLRRTEGWALVSFGSYLYSLVASIF